MRAILLLVKTKVGKDSVIGGKSAGVVLKLWGYGATLLGS